jgi:RNA polymerase sigma-70 factor (ECF subfamily)
VATTDAFAGTASDELLIDRLARRDERALALLYDRHGPSAFALACRVTGDRHAAEEVVQEAFLSLWRGAATYRPERGAGRTWLLAIVRHRAIDVVRAREARPRTTTIDDLPLADRTDPAEAALAALRGAAVRAAVAALPPAQRAAVELAYFAGLSYPEVSDRLGIPLGTVKSRLRLALERLRWLLAVERSRCGPPCPDPSARAATAASPARHEPHRPVPHVSRGAAYLT